MKAKLDNMIDRIGVFQSAWLENAPDAAFAGMTLAEFKEAVKAPGDLRGEIQALQQKTGRKRVQALKSVAEAGEVLDLVVNSVKGTPGYGADSALYRAFGYVRKSERRTGLTRKRAQIAPSTDAA
jgi:hypothetical protein